MPVLSSLLVVAGCLLIPPPAPTPKKNVSANINRMLKHLTNIPIELRASWHCEGFRASLLLNRSICKPIARHPSG